VGWECMGDIGSSRVDRINEVIYFIIIFIEINNVETFRFLNKKSF